MSLGESNGRKQHRIDEEAKAAFLHALREGLRRDDAAARAGFTANGFYYARRRDPLFDLAWCWAVDLSAAEQRAAFNAASRHLADNPDASIAPNRNRILQRRIVRRPRFHEGRKRIFLDHFAGTADAHAAAQAAGVGYGTVTTHRRKDAAFAAAWDEALAHAYALLEAEAVRQRLEAQRLMREGLCPTGEIAREFERVMQLLARYERRNGAIGQRAVAPGHQKSWTFEEAIAALDRKLAALGARRPLPPPEEQTEE